MTENNTNIDIEDLKNLNHATKQNNFKIPENYFDDFAKKMEQELAVQNKSRSRGIVRTMIINLSIAAAVVIGVFVFTPSKEPVVEVAKAIPQEVLVEDYVISMISDAEEWSPTEELFMNESFKTEIEVLLSSEFEQIDATTTEDLYEAFEDEWEDNNYYEY